MLPALTIIIGLCIGATSYRSHGAKAGASLFGGFMLVVLGASLSGGV